MSRYDQLLTLIDQIKPSFITEIGTWNGERALRLLGRARHYHNKLHYRGYDLFQTGTDDLDARELNVKPRQSLEEVSAKLAAFSRKNPGTTFELIEGDTRQTLKPHKGDFAWIDGGHSVETIFSDWNNLGDFKMVALDDYYSPDENGKCPDISKFGCNQLLEHLRQHESSNWDIRILPSNDRVKGGGIVQIVVCRRRK